MPSAMPATSVPTALTRAARRTRAQNSGRASSRKAIAAMWKARPITSPISSMTDSSPVSRSTTFQPTAATM
jgi:hypothetical protein